VVKVPEGVFRQLGPVENRRILMISHGRKRCRGLSPRAVKHLSLSTLSLGLALALGLPAVADTLKKPEFDADMQMFTEMLVRIGNLKQMQ
jgi:ABC-type proline/glycine betaine transport system permease subunit